MYIGNNFKLCSDLLLLGRGGDLLAYGPMGSADSPSLVVQVVEHKLSINIVL
jgi:hypothetical protein